MWTSPNETHSILVLLKLIEFTNVPKIFPLLLFTIQYRISGYSEQTHLREQTFDQLFRTSPLLLNLKLTLIRLWPQRRVVDACCFFRYKAERRFGVYD